MSLDSPESFLPHEAQQTLSAIESVKKHPFEFGYRTAFKNGSADIYLKDNKWRMKMPRPTKDDKEWYGNCVEDSTMSAAELRERVGKGAKVTIQHMEADGLGNAPFSTDHYRTLIEHPNPTNSIIAEIDHSPYHTFYLNGENKQINKWVDLDDSEEKDLIGSGTRDVIDSALDGVAYTEFDINKTRGIAYLNIDFVNEKSLKIYFSFIMPGLEKGKTNKSIGFPVFSHQLPDKTSVLNIIDTDPFFNTAGSAGSDNNADLIPNDLKPQLKDWLKEVIGRLPEKIESPNT